MSDYRVQIRIKNARILRLMQAAGYESIAALSRATGVGHMVIGRYINLQESPYNNKNDWRDSILTISAYLKCDPEDMFTERQKYSFMRKNSREVDVSEAAVMGYIGSDAPEAAIEVQKLLPGLNPREYAIVTQLFGLDGDGEKTLDDVAEIHQVTRERIRQIESKAIRKMQHLSVMRAKKAKTLCIEHDQQGAI